MTLEKTPFQSYTLDEDKAEKAVIKHSVRLTDQEQEWLEYLKEYFNVADDASVIRLAIEGFHNDVKARWPKRKSRWLYRKDRKRKSDY